MTPSIIVALRLTDAERAALEAKRRKGESLSECMRRILLGRAVEKRNA